MKTKQKELLTVALKCIIYAGIAGGFSVLFHMLCSRFILHEHKPDFMSNSLYIYSIAEKILIGIGYYVLGKKLPVKKPVLRGLSYMGLYWLSNFLPQFMGLAFADGPIAAVAFKFSDLVCDTSAMMLSGIFLGLLFKKEECGEFKKKINGKAVAVGMLAFPVMIAVVDQIMMRVYRPFSSVGAIEVSDAVKVPFVINFYAWFLLSGAMITVFYILTDYRDGKGWLSFALKYSLLLWTSVVMIMVIFGTEFVGTAVFAVIFILVIMVLCWIVDKVLRATEQE